MSWASSWQPLANDSDTSTTKSRGLAPMKPDCSGTSMPATGQAVCAPQKRGMSSRPICGSVSSRGDGEMAQSGRQASSLGTSTICITP